MLSAGTWNGLQTSLKLLCDGKPDLMKRIHVLDAGLISVGTSPIVMLAVTLGNQLMKGADIIKACEEAATRVRGVFMVCRVFFICLV